MRLDPECDGSAKISMENLGTILSFAHLGGSTRADEALLELLDLVGILIERHVRPPYDLGSEMFLDATRAVARSTERIERKAGGYQLEFENEAQWFTRDDISADRVTTEDEEDARRAVLREAAAMSREMERLRIADTENRNKITKKVVIEESSSEKTGEPPRESMPPPSTPFGHRREGHGGGRPEAGRLPFPPVTRQDPMSQIGMEVPRNLGDIPGHTRWDDVEDSEDGQDVNMDDENEDDIAYADESVRSSLFGSDDEGSDFPVGEMAPGSKKKPKTAERLIKNEVIDQIWNKGRLRREWWTVIDRMDRTLYHDIERKLGDVAGQKWTGDMCINDLSLPAKWLRKIDWGFHCNQCKAWWFGEIKIDLESRQQYPNLGMRCWLCQRYAQDVREIVDPDDADEVAWAKRAAEMIGAIVNGPPPPNFWAALVQANNVHESDPRRIAARLADRMAVEGHPWDAIVRSCRHTRC